MDGDGMDRFRGRVYLLVAAIPAGRVATYGQIAALAGHPRRARHWGHALAAAFGEILKATMVPGDGLQGGRAAERPEYSQRYSALHRVPFDSTFTVRRCSPRRT